REKHTMPARILQHFALLVEKDTMPEAVPWSNRTTNESDTHWRRSGVESSLGGIYESRAQRVCKETHKGGRSKRGRFLNGRAGRWTSNRTGFATNLDRNGSSRKNGMERNCGRSRIRWVDKIDWRETL